MKLEEEMNKLKETNTTIIACQESVDRVNIATSSWFIVIFFSHIHPMLQNIQI